MIISDNRIDCGIPFDWGRTSQNYAKYRNIYPQEFQIRHYEAITVLRKK